MKRLRFDYQMQITFTQPVWEHYFTLKCFPKSIPRQTILEREIMVTPDDSYQMSEDGFGNESLYGHCERKHTKFEVRVTGIAEVDWSIYDTNAAKLYLYRMPTRMTALSEQMEAFAKEEWGNLKFFRMGTLNKAHEIMNTLYRILEYESGSTKIDTTAEQAFSQRKGVCQDYAHIMIAFCRYYKIPARYVAGMMIGEGYSHAWVEIYSNGRWYGFDPTNHLLIDSHYIMMAVGRDSKDCVLNKGHFYGKGEQNQKIHVSVEEI
jgi:transglutaminase-like putative cysteine protease